MSVIRTQHCPFINKNNMEIMQVIFILFVVITVSIQKPFVFEDNISICSYQLGPNHEKINITSNIWAIKLEEIEIYFKLCGKFANKNLCPVETSACVKNLKDKNSIVLGRDIELVGNHTFSSINGDHCKKSNNYSIIVGLHCSQDLEDVYLEKISEDQCTYHIKMRDPKCMSIPRCTIYIDGKFIDLRALGKPFFISGGDRNFSISLCAEDPVCNEDGVNACEIIGDKKTPISLASPMAISYVGKNNQLSFHGITYAEGYKKFDKRFEVILKCDWDKKDVSNTDLKYVKKQIQGKRYTFHLETSYGCIKKPVPCVVNDQFLDYNLSGLYNEHHGMWFTNGGGTKGNSIYFLQPCGPVELEGKNTSCRSTYAQVCENNNGVDINRGSVLRHLVVDNNFLRATIESGMQCQEHPDSQYQTFIIFYCDKDEKGPKFLQQENCNTYFEWKTPHACPKYNVASCSHIHEEYHTCSFEQANKYYNLGELAKTQISIKNGSKEFLINICGPVIHPDAPCMKDVSVVFRNLTEVNLKYKVKSLGKLAGSSTENGNLVLEYATGSFCNGTDYTSKIRFECSILQEGPIIIKQEKCHYEFLWKTKYGCPFIKQTKKETYNVKNCTYVDSYSNRSVDLGPIDQSSTQLYDFKYNTLTFNICHQNYTNCTQNNDDCDNVPFKNSVFTSSRNLTTLEFTLPKICQTKNDFNKINVKFICDQVINNNHIDLPIVVNCTLSINYFTNLVCSLNDNDLPIEQIQQPIDPIFPSIGNLSLHSPETTTGECYKTRSPYTSLELNISNLTSLNDLFKKTCPIVSFNNTYRFVKLFYITTDICSVTRTKNVSYEVYLKCTNDIILPSVEDECLEHYNYEKPEYCDFFKLTTRSSMSIGSIIGLIVGILLLAALVVIGLSIIIKKKVFRTPSSYGFISVYQKDTEI